MAPKNKMSREEMLLKKRLRERERYKKIKEDPIKAGLQKIKEQKKYDKKLKNKQVKPIQLMSVREARCKRKQWRKNSKNYYKRKIEGEREPEMPDTPSSSDQEPNIVPQPVQVSSGRKRIHRDRSRVIQRNKKLMEENAKLKTLLAKYKQRYYRGNEKKIKNKDMTPRTKVKTIIASKDRHLVKRKLLFGAALEYQLRSNFQNRKSFKAKKSFASTVIGNGHVLKKCKVVKGLSEIFTTRLANCKTTNGLRQRSEKKIAAEVKENVRKFLEDDENSRQAPGKKDCITRKKVKKHTIPGRYTAQPAKVVYWKDLKPGKFVLVQFHSTGKIRNIYRYACIVQGKDDDDGEVFVQGLKLLNAKTNEFIVNDKDMSSVKYEDIVENLDEPTIVLKNGRQLVYKFKRSIDVFEKC